MIGAGFASNTKKQPGMNRQDELSQEPVNKPMNWDFVEKEHIEKVLKHFSGNKRQTALAIGWAINTLNAKMEKYGLES